MGVNLRVRQAALLSPCARLAAWRPLTLMEAKLRSRPSCRAPVSGRDRRRDQAAIAADWLGLIYFLLNIHLMAGLDHPSS